MAKRVYRQDADDTANVPAKLTAEEERLIQLSEKNTKFQRDELVIPRLKVLQQMNPEVQEGGNQYIAGAKAGMFYNTASGKLTPGQEGMIICILGHQKQNIEWLSNTPGAGMVKNWGMDEGWKALCDPAQQNAFNPMTREGHYIQKQRVFLIFDIDVKTGAYDPSFYSLYGTATKVANQLGSTLTQTRLRMSDGRIITPPYYYYLYKLTLNLVRNAAGQSWWLPHFVKHTDKAGLHMRTESLPNGKEIFETAATLQVQFLEGDIQQTDWERDDGDSASEDKIPF